ncbi:Ribosomal silencing factor [Fragilaria crotonensis]|nr:Ribosomal silencing factor [Fragilaria crotonensis]
MSPLRIFLALILGVATAWVPSCSYPKRKVMALHDKARHEQQTEFMEKGPASVVGDMPDLTDDLDLVRTIAKAGDGRKAEDIVGLQVAQISTLTSFMVFLSGNSRPQNQAIVAAIMEEVEEKFGIIRNPQGTAGNRRFWMDGPRLW